MGNHAAAFHGGQDQPDKGQPGGSCNRTACQRPKAFWRNDNLVNPKYYCGLCARDLNRTNGFSEFWKSLVLEEDLAEKHNAASKAA